MAKLTNTVLYQADIGVIIDKIKKIIKAHKKQHNGKIVMIEIPFDNLYLKREIRYGRKSEIKESRILKVMGIDIIPNQDKLKVVIE